MKETTFIDKNKEKWHEFEKLSRAKSTDPDKLSELFVELTEDLSYAKTFYPKRTVRVYLNYLAQKVFMSFHKQKKGFLRDFALFWIQKLPFEMYRSRNQFFHAFLFLAVSVLIGCVSSFIDEDFARVIMGDGYMNMTEENINSGDPMKVYKEMPEGSMFLWITQNNIKVAFITFILGVFFSIGSVFMLLRTGFMLGAFQYFFYSKGLFLTSFLTIWIHGTLEISAIVIAGAAGIVMGNGLLFPKTLTRTQSFQISAKRGMNILLGTVPIFIVAGFLEGYVTRHTEMSSFSKWFIILFSLAFVVYYYIIYPKMVAKSFPDDLRVEEKPAHQESAAIQKHRIREISGVFYDTFRFYKTYFLNIGTIIVAVILPLAIIYLSALYYFSPIADYDLTMEELGAFIMSGLDHFTWTGLIANVAFISLNIATVVHCFQFLEKPNSKPFLQIWIKEIWPYFIKAFIITLLLYSLFFFTPFYVSLLFILLMPFVLNVFYPVISSENSFADGINKGLSYGSKSWGNSLLVFILMLAMVYFFSWLYHNPIFEDFDIKSLMLDEIIDWHTLTVFDNFMTIRNFISSLFVMMLIQLLIPLLVIAFSFQFLSTQDKEEAIGLKKRMKKFGKGSKIYEKVG